MPETITIRARRQQGWFEVIVGKRDVQPSDVTTGRTRVLNDDLEALFRAWYPAFRLPPDTGEAGLAA